MPRKLTVREKELETLAHRAGELLRKDGIWVLPEAIDERKDGRIALSMSMFPRDWIKEHDNSLPTQTILRLREAGQRASSWKHYEIPEGELEDNPFATK